MIDDPTTYSCRLFCTMSFVRGCSSHFCLAIVRSSLRAMQPCVRRNVQPFGANVSNAEDLLLQQYADLFDNVRSGTLTDPRIGPPLPLKGTNAISAAHASAQREKEHLRGEFPDSLTRALIHLLTKIVPSSLKQIRHFSHDKPGGILHSQQRPTLA